MKILALDTSAPVGSVAIWEGRILIREVFLPREEKMAVTLMGAVDQLLKEVSWTLSDLDGFGVTLGPGSFTGIRIGLAAVEGLALPQRKPIAAFSSLEILAAHVQNFFPIPMIDAHRGEVYVNLPQEKVTTPGRLCTDLIEKTGPFTFVGSGAEFYKDCIQKALGSKAHFLNGIENLPHAATVAQLACQKFKGGLISETSLFIPSYIRRSDAEGNFKNS